MKQLIQLLTISMMFGCSDVAENPTSPGKYQSVPSPVLNIIRSNCEYCHRPGDNFFILKGQKPYFGIWLPDSSDTFLDTIQIWQSKERIGFRVAERTMPRINDTTFKFLSLRDEDYNIIGEWAKEK